MPLANFDKRGQPKNTKPKNAKAFRTHADMIFSNMAQAHEIRSVPFQGLGAIGLGRKVKVHRHELLHCCPCSALESWQVHFQPFSAFYTCSRSLVRKHLKGLSKDRAATRTKKEAKLTSLTRLCYHMSCHRTLPWAIVQVCP